MAEFRYSQNILLQFTVILFHSNLYEKVTSNEQKLTSNEQKITSNQQRVTRNEQKITSKKQTNKQTKNKKTSNKQKLTNDKQRAKSNEQQSASKKFNLYVCLVTKFKCEALFLVNCNNKFNKNFDLDNFICLAIAIELQFYITTFAVKHFVQSSSRKVIFQNNSGKYKLLH